MAYNITTRRRCRHLKNRLKTMSLHSIELIAMCIPTVVILAKFGHVFGHIWPNPATSGQIWPNPATNHNLHPTHCCSSIRWVIKFFFYVFDLPAIYFPVFPVFRPRVFSVPLRDASTLGGLCRLSPACHGGSLSNRALTHARRTRAVYFILPRFAPRGRFYFASNCRRASPFIHIYGFGASDGKIFCRTNSKFKCNLFVANKLQSFEIFHF